MTEEDHKEWVSSMLPDADFRALLRKCPVEDRSKVRSLLATVGEEEEEDKMDVGGCF